jgi:hypothetical protein
MLAVARSTQAILRWSWWRQRQGARAQAAHYRRRLRARTLPERPPDVAVSQAPAREPQADAVIERVWSRLLALLPATKQVGRPFAYERRVIFEAIVYVLQTDCGWRNLPTCFPPWQTVYAQYAQWRKKGIWETIWAGLTVPRRET